MKIILKHILRNIKEKKGRSLLIILSLIIATTVLVINLTLPDELVVKFEETLRLLYGNAEVSIAQMDEFDIKDIKTNGENFNYVGMSSIDATQGKRITQIMGISIKDGKNMKLIPNDVPDLKENEVVINKKQAKKFGYKKGQIISINVADSENEQTYELKIAKIVDSKGILSLNLDSPVFLANIDTINNIKGIEKEKYQTYYIDVENDDKINDFEKYIKENNKEISSEVLISIENVREQTKFISYIMLMIFAISIVMIFFVVGTLNKLIIAERIPVIGTFRSIGATKENMNLILVLENAIYGLIGGIIGCGFGYLVKATVALKFFSTTDGIEISKQTSSMSIGTIILSILFAVILEVFISIRAIMRTNKKSIKNIIFNVQSTRYRIRKFNTSLGFVMFTLSFIINALNKNSNIALVLLSIVFGIAGIANIVPLIMRVASKILSVIFRKIGWGTGIISSRNIGYNKMIISSSRLIVVALSSIFTILTISTSFSKTIETFKYITDYDIMINNVYKTSDEYEHLKEIEGVKDIEYVYYYITQNATYNNKTKFNIMPIIIGLNESTIEIKELDYKVKDLKYNEMLIDEKYAEKNNIKVNDKIKLELPSLNKTVEYKIVGLVNATYFTTSRNVVIANLDNYKENISNVPTTIEVTVEEGKDLEKMKTTLKDKIREIGIQIMTADEYITEQEKQTGGIMGIFYVIIGITVALAFIGIINNQIISFMQRKREIAVLNSTCMSKGQIKKMLMTETVFANTVACIVAILVGYLMTGIIKNALISMAMYVELKFDWIISIEFILVVFVILLLTLVNPIRRLRKIKLIDEIKYE